jgi:hypothetical protein
VHRANEDVNGASANVAHVTLVDTSLSRNQDGDIIACGACAPGEVLPGTDDHLDISLRSVTRELVISAVDSEPPMGTDTVRVVHHGRP